MVHFILVNVTSVKKKIWPIACFDMAHKLRMYFYIFK